MLAHLILLATASALNIFRGADWSTSYISLSSHRVSKVFHYLIKASHSHSDALLIWIGSGPGCSASNVLFLESGPYAFGQKLDYGVNEFAWNKLGDVAYLDFPFGTGLSESENGEEALRSVSAAANELNAFMVYFLGMNKEYSSKKLYFACESYSCQIVLKFAANYVSSGQEIEGIMLRSPMINYRVQSNWASFARSLNKINLLDYWLNSILLFFCRIGIQLNSESMIRALCDPTMEQVATRARIPCLDNVNNTRCYDEEYYAVHKLVNNGTVQRSFGMDKEVAFTACNTSVSYYMDVELKRGDAKSLGYLLNKKVKVSMIFGQNNFMYNWVGGEEMANGVEWERGQEFRAKKWEHDDCGKRKEAGALGLTVLNKAGQVMTRENDKCFFKELAKFMQANNS